MKTANKHTRNQAYPPLTAARLREVLDYNPDTGEFRWKKAIGRGKVGSVPKCISANGYLRLQVDGHMVLQHRLAIFMTTDKWPTGMVDHINRVKTDNRIVNLREVSRSENAHNAPAHKDNTSGHKGVYWHKNINKWSAQIYLNGKNTVVGYFVNIEDAIKARAEAERTLLPKIYTNQQEHRGAPEMAPA